MRLKEFIPEARRNPELNPRHHTIDVLSRLYAQTVKNNDYISEDIPNFFASFTRIEKLGIRPDKTYVLNPVGVYAHPVKAILEDGNVENFYAGDRPLVNVFQISGSVLNLETIDSQQQTELYEQARHWIPESYVRILPRFRDSTEWWQSMLNLRSKHFKKIWRCDAQVATNKLFRTLGFTAIIDPGMYLITPDIETQLIVLDVRTIKNNQTFPNLYRKTDLTDNDLAQKLAHYIVENSVSKLKELINQTQNLNEFNAVESVIELLEDPDLVILLINWIPTKSSGYFIRELENRVRNRLNAYRVYSNLREQILTIIDQAWLTAKQKQLTEK